MRRLEHYRETGRTGWQWHSPFPEVEVRQRIAILMNQKELLSHLNGLLLL